MTASATPGPPEGLKLSPCPPVPPAAPGETPLKLRRVAIDIYRSLHQPNDKLVELLLAAPAARELGAQRLWLLAPYLADMRQDTAFMPGEGQPAPRGALAGVGVRWVADRRPPLAPRGDAGRRSARDAAAGVECRATARPDHRRAL